MQGSDQPSRGRGSASTIVNDIHSKLNETTVAEVVRPRSVKEVQAAVRRARETGGRMAIAGGYHSMGGQQFLTGGTLLDMRSMSRVLGVDCDRGIVDVEAGAQWSDFVPELRAMQGGDGPKWSIVQKQTGADRLSLGGAVAANGHGRGLRFQPIVQDVESFTLVDSDGELRECSRSANADLFRAAIGGYGLFGVITSIRLRLQPRHRLERVVEVFDVEGLPDAFRSRIDEGFTYGDFQYMTDESSGGFLRQGVFSCYRPVDAAPSNGGRTNVTLSSEDWTKLIHLAHVDKARAFEEYVRFYTSTSGQTYDSDDFQMSTYIDGYHAALDAAAGAASPGSETITELYVPVDALAGFMDASREVLTAHGSNVIYGTIRLIEPEHETLLGWAARRYACIVFNLHVEHTPPGVQRVAGALRGLIDVALSFGGSYFLTYNRFATSDQLVRAYPRFPQFLDLKRRMDPDNVFSSDWYEHYRAGVSPTP